MATGNDDINAFNYSPASTPEALTVAASDNTDTRAYFSNRGPCGDLFAPGVNITSADMRSGSGSTIRRRSRSTG
ncbi:MAG: S8 family serine peptidase [Deltaproteobacteria bacterium]|nr:S8 family serine peptidase [Deltaproteobacteria bacterium]